MQNVYTKKSSIVFFLIVFLSITGFAQRSGGGKFSIGAMTLFGTGKMGNGLVGTNNAADRDMLYTPIGLFAGFNLKKIRIGLNYEYMMVGQTTDPGVSGDNILDGTNISGTGTSPGVRLEYYDGKNSFGVVYRLSNEYKLDKVSFAGNPTVYKGSGGISVQFMRQIKNKVGFVIDYTTETFSDSLTTGNIKWSRVGLGLVISNFNGGGR